MEGLFMAKNENRMYVTLLCNECKNESRVTSKNKKNTPDRIELSRYCKKCRKHTNHKEKK